MLAIEVDLLTRRYVASSHSDRSRSEWPPHPARLYSAFVANAPAKGREPAEHEALEWLATLGAPEIAASEAYERQLVTVFVPVNDTSVTNVDDALVSAVKAGRAGVEAARNDGAKTEIRKAEKDLARAEKRLADWVAKAFSPGANPSNEDLLQAPKLVPEQRGRQARTFPSVTPIHPKITYVWPNAQASFYHRQALDRVAARIVRLGHSSSLVSVRVTEAAVPTQYKPSDEGRRRFRVPQRGQLQRLDEAFERHRETETRVMPCGFQIYSSSSEKLRREETHSVFGDDWLVLQRIDGPRVPCIAAAGVARAIRSALMKFSRQPPPELISGHREPDVPSTRPHLAIVPLPFVGHSHADGALLGVALVLPREPPPEERRALYLAIDAWERSGADPDSPQMTVLLGKAGVWKLQRIDERAEQRTLRAESWSRRARSWVTATPIALDRHPGDLHDRDSSRQARAYAEAEQTVRAACGHVGLPAPTVVNVLSFAPIAGARKAREYAPFPSESERTRRQLVHAAIEFNTEVRGPILLGAGRYLGLGLFRPVDHA